MTAFGRRVNQLSAMRRNTGLALGFHGAIEREPSYAGKGIEIQKRIQPGSQGTLAFINGWEGGLPLRCNLEA